MLVPDATHSGCCNLTDVRISYHGRQVLFIPKLCIDTPCRIALIGPSGAGKSTLAGLLGSFLPEHTQITGDIHIPNSIGAISQDTFGALNPLMRIIDQVALTAGSKTEAKRHLLAIGLPEKLHSRYPLQLSGGQRQRAAIAFALSQSPQLLIADEVTSALDPIASAEVLTTLRNVSGPNTTTSLLMITHNIRAAHALCQRVIEFVPNPNEQGFIAEEQAA
ncbi:Glutamine transport ATP-binding protein GlnQ [Corynebacterium freiburgense]|nr:Glutamine transport ATP-binding protein GlnQ [Corynebacterium freiburgense]